MSAGLHDRAFRGGRWRLLLDGEAEINLFDPRRNRDTLVVVEVHGFVQGERRDESRGRQRVMEDSR